MNLYLRVENGLPIGHPIVESNLLEIYPSIDLENLPEDLAVFERVVAQVGVYEVYVNTTYESVNGVWKDVHTIRPMTAEEKTSKQNTVKQNWADTVGFNSWIFSEELCQFVPPVAIPNDGKSYLWNEGVVNWVEVVA